MKQIIIFFFVFILCGVSFADTEKYAVQYPDGTVGITYYLPGSDKTIDEIAKELGAVFYKAIEPEEISVLSENPKYLKLENGKVTLDREKKESDALGK